ncbi:MAG TPA: hypothetical protein VMM79_14970 [Longimicrobiales bacterium]|nr:hypothetical protein [Longimicrobiales bacterium]
MSIACRAAVPVLVLTLALHTAGCSLTETSLADGNDIVIAELVLRAGDTAPQRAFLYRTIGSGQASVVSGAAIEVSDAAGRAMTFVEVPARNCIDDVMGPVDGTCYIQDGDAVAILAGSTYSLRITLRDGSVLTGTTTVPGDFEIGTPSDAVCRLDPGTTIDLRWTPARDAWVYVTEAGLNGLAEALAAQGIELEDEPLRLLGLSISREDTTLAFPTGFGLFDRADPAVADALLAIRDGLPPGVRASVVVAAADRNYVNWVRGANFNPSGLVRVPSVRGDGTGVFGSIVARAVVLTTVPESTAPACE